jgi:hypothetical protein
MVKLTNKLWTKQEEKLLSSVFPTQGIKVSALILNRSESSVAKKASRLGLKSRSHCMTHEEYEQKLFDKEIDYWPTEQYSNIRTAIEHECLVGHKWKITPHEVLKGNGCPYCNTINKTRTSEEYSLLIKDRGFSICEAYVNSSTPIEHKCKFEHIWKTWPHHILAGTGCPYCADYGFKLDKPAIMYYIKIGDYYKIGITNRTVRKRFELDLDKPIKILSESYFDTGMEAKNAEKELLDLYKDERITIPNYLKSGGNTELFVEDILELDVS